MGTTSPLSAAEQQANANLEQLVADVDRGGRNVGGIAGAVLFCGAIAWSLFQLWYASPLPFALNFGILNDTEARAVHLGIAMFLGRSEEHTSELQSLMRISYAVFCLTKKNKHYTTNYN